MSPDKNKTVLNRNEMNIWKPCARCGVLCYKSDWCKPCKLKVFSLDPHPLRRFQLNTVIDIFNEIILHICRSKKS